MNDPAPAPRSQFELLRERRFLPYFIVQFFGAFNDNVYKNALISMFAFITVNSVSQKYSAEDSALLINLSAAVFILPFFLFSALSGQYADKYEKSMLIRRIKLAEIAIMCFAAIAFYLQNTVLLIAVLFLLGSQSTLFGPIKYGILPQHLKPSELVGGNGIVEMGTFIAILLGTIVGTQLITVSDTWGTLYVSGLIISIALIGYVASRQIPSAPATAPDLEIDYNIIRETVRLIAYTRKNRVIFQSILGISWFWMMGAIYLAQFPVYARDVLGGTASVVSLLLVFFSVGIGLGSALCERLSDHRVEIGLVPFGAIGITLFGIDLYAATPTSPFGSELGAWALLADARSWRIVFDVFAIGVFGGLYIVPLYALIQQISKPDRLSRAIACNNILNALFMVGSAVLAMALFAIGFSIAQVFLVAALLNALVAAYIFTLVPEFLMRFITWILIHTLYRVEKTGLHHVPDKGAVILASNHISFVDPLIIGGCVRRPVRFVMYYKIYRIPILHFVFRTAKAIPIAGRKEDEEMFNRAFREMEQAIRQGDVLCIFPEGEISATGEFNPFRPGIMHLLEVTPAPVIPVALQGLWGSMFSRKGGPAFFKLPKKLFARIGLVLGEPIPPECVNVQELQQLVLEMRGPRL